MGMRPSHEKEKLLHHVELTSHISTRHAMKKDITITRSHSCRWDSLPSPVKQSSQLHGIHNLQGQLSFNCKQVLTQVDNAFCKALLCVNCLLAVIQLRGIAAWLRCTSKHVVCTRCKPQQADAALHPHRA